MTFRLKPLQAAFIVAFSLPSLTLSTVAKADPATDARIEALEQQVKLLTTKLQQVSTKQDAPVTAAAEVAAAPAASPALGERTRKFFEAIKDVEFYGNLDVSVDGSTKGLKNSYNDVGGNRVVSPVGQNGWQSDLSTNLSYVGIRGKHPVGDTLSLVYQLETQIDITATAGSANSTSAQDTTVKGALTTRNSYVGLADARWGAVKIGKTDAPYKTSTARMNPFSGMWGDYSVIMGNTGGDNRVEFGTRLDHALWYESPKWHGWSFNALISPGQNRGYENSIQASGESSCTGGNIPGSGGGAIACVDGSYGTAYSANVAYENGPLYVTGAYELHSRVNRTGDVAGTPQALASPIGLDPNDVGNEYAYKIGAQYAFPTKTTLSAIYEVMRRNIPAYLNEQNERSRNGYWLALTQELTPDDSLSVGWAHANATPGDPGQHNTSAADGIGTISPDNAANMYTVAYKHKIDKQTTWYANYAVTANHALAHYDLGAGGRGVTTDCHDGQTIAAGAPNCYAGGRLQGISAGVNYKF
ncbi:porin [Collimonas sp. H4R21]|uniref:Porin n=1 Tax=Collimonas rhizosphaerae TaxID=3126357 RepID=A0ABU9Q2E6_9BURK